MLCTRVKFPLGFVLGMGLILVSGYGSWEWFYVRVLPKPFGKKWWPAHLLLFHTCLCQRTTLVSYQLLAYILTFFLDISTPPILPAHMCALPGPCWISGSLPELGQQVYLHLGLAESLESHLGWASVCDPSPYIV